MCVYLDFTTWLGETCAIYFLKILCYMHFTIGIDWKKVESLLTFDINK